MSHSRRFRAYRTITNPIEDWVLFIGSVVIALLVATFLFKHASWKVMVVFFVIWVCVFLLLWFAYKILLPASFVMDDNGIEFKGTRYGIDELNTVAITPKGNLTIVLKDQRDRLQIRPYNHALISEDDLKSWCVQHDIAFRHMGHGTKWWHH